MGRGRGKREEGGKERELRVYNNTKLAHSQNKPMHRMKLSWRRKEGRGKRDGTGRMEEALQKKQNHGGRENE